MIETIGQAQAIALAKLHQAKIKTAALDAAVLLGFVLNKPKEYIYAHPEKWLTEKQRMFLNKIIVQRAKGAPVAYLTGHKEFFGLDFIVDNHVLIPRPKTEILVERAMALINENFHGGRVRIADIGTGSGCIAVALAKNIPNAKIFSVDISAAALKIAKRNARRHGVSKQIRFYQGDLLRPLQNKSIDILVANLPYLRSSRIRGDVRFEPRAALVSGVNGLAHYKRLAEQLAQKISMPRFIILEADKDQHKKIRAGIGQIKIPAPDRLIRRAGRTKHDMLRRHELVEALDLA